MEAVTTHKVISSWRDLQVLYESLNADSGRQWVFRGQRDSRWDLASSLERAIHHRFDEPLARMRDFERWLVAEFRRHAHRFTSDLPRENDIFRWLALMQHHGAPTRLVDFTYSFYVGVYFAIECATPGDHCGLWAIDADWCWSRAKEQLNPELVQRIEADTTRGKTPELQAEVSGLDVPAALPDNSFFLDERLAAQQGVFLVPLDLTKSFMQNLGSAGDYVRRYEICCTLEFLKVAFVELRKMNITRVSLFPDLDGLAFSLGPRIAITDPSRVLGVAEHGA